MRVTKKSLLRKHSQQLESVIRLLQESNDLQRVKNYWLEKVVEKHGL